MSNCDEVRAYDEYVFRLARVKALKLAMSVIMPSSNVKLTIGLVVISLPAIFVDLLDVEFLHPNKISNSKKVMG